MISLSLMVLLTVLATGLLGLASIELRKSSSSDARAAACANARLGLMLALGQLQKDLGDDRRITADASILRSTAQPNLVGIWDSWTPGLTTNPLQAVGTDFYDKEKTGRFRGWLVSDPNPQQTRTRELAGQQPAENAVKMFRVDSDGFDIRAPRVPITEGAYSWVVTQEGTRAKVNIGGPETNERNPNDDLQAQARPNLALSTSFKQPTGEWDSRSVRVLSPSQAKLDETLGSGVLPTAWQDYTTHSMGLLTDVVKGGLKVDLNLGFEMSDSNFSKDTLATGYPNPFRAGATDFASAVPSGYKGQRPLYRPNTSTATHTARLDQFDAAKVLFDYPGAGVPTFNTLRSFYRIPYHLYTDSGNLTVFERPSDHVAFKTTSVPGGLFRTPWNTPPATTTQSSIRPVVDRVMFLLSAGLTANSEPSLVITPVITLWNPYNVALEIEGAVAYPWLDIPFNLTFNVYNSGSGSKLREHGTGMANLLGRQLKSMSGHGRSVDPYFYAAVTGTGGRISGTAKPIRFDPGEVRVFTCTTSTRKAFQPVDYTSPSNQVSIAGITTYLRPVESITDFSTKGGFEVRLSETKMVSGESADMLFGIATGEDFPCFISVEDATRAKGSTATTGNRGQALADVLQRNYGQSGEFGKIGGTDRSTGFRSTKQTFASLRQEPAPFAALEFYHRYAKTGQDQSGDLLYTGNPRQPWMAQYMTNATFPSGPQYKLRVRGPLTSFGNLLEVEQGSGGRRAFYGPSNSAQTGKSRLSFFEIPRAPMLSMAAFQHADLSATPFGPANQFANSWASAYVPRNRAMVAQTGSGETARPPVYDTIYLANEALWDGFFFSGASPVINQNSASGSPNVWSNPNGTTTSLHDVLEKFVEDSSLNPLRNPRMRLVKGDNITDKDLVDDLLEPEGCMKIAAHLMVDGAFNINSTSVEAWTTFLSGLRGTPFKVDSGSAPAASATAFPRFQYPTGQENDHWNGFRTLTDDQVKTLAQNIVKEVQDRGPFLSLGEFVNRRVSSADNGLKGALQAAIDNGGVNTASLYDTLRVSFTEGAMSYGYPAQSRTNVNPARTGVGIPGYLTQADVLQSIAPVITARSDTFTIRGYGEAHDADGKITATAMCEAVVQRFPEFVDQRDNAYTAVGSLNDVNKKFGRRFSVVSFRYLSAEEMRS